MFKILKGKDAVRNPVLEMSITEPTDEITLFGKTYRMYHDDWKHHVHLKCTNRCDADCAFCIERSSRSDYEDADAFLDSAKEVVDALVAQGQFRTLSVTGGEPTLFSKLDCVIRMANESNATLFSINSNGARMNAIAKGTFRGWLDLSKHAIDDRSIFHRSLNIGVDDIRMFKERQPESKVRVQCVLGSGGLASIGDILHFMDYFKGVADDFSFRSLIVENHNDSIPPIFTQFRDWLFEGGMIVEQAIQDYYVYEIYELNGERITLSWSRMDMLKKYNEAHEGMDDGNFLEEVIVHPDGMVTGSWNKKTLVIRGSNKAEPATRGEIGLPDKCIRCPYLTKGCRYRGVDEGCGSC